MKITSFIILYLFCSRVQAQQWVWDTLAPIGWNYHHQIHRDDLGHLYTLGHYDSCIFKFTTAGFPLGQINLPKKFKVRSMTCSPDSSVYILGTFSDTMTVNGHMAVGKGGDDICIAKYSASGNIQWLASAGSRRQETAADICMQGTDILVIGTTKDTMHFSSQVVPKDTIKEFFIAKFSSTGQYITSKIARHFLLASTDFCRPDEIKTDHSGNVYGLVWLKGHFLWDNDTIVAPYGQYLIKFSSGLVYQDKVQLSSYYADVASDLTFNSLDEIYHVHTMNLKYSSLATIRKMNNFSSAPVSHYMQQGTIPGIDLDSCDNIYFVANANNSYPGPYIPQYWNSVGQLSPGGNLNWMRVDSAADPIGILDVANIGLNKVFTKIFFHDSITLVNTYTTQLHGAKFINAILQHTFGIPAIVTPQAHQICEGKQLILSLNTGGTVHWFNAAIGSGKLHTGNNYTVSAPAGTYTYYAEARTCSLVSNRVPVTVTVNPSPTISVADGTICTGEKFIISPTPALSYTFSSGSATVAPLVNSSYTILGADQNNCLATAFVSVLVSPLPTINVQSSQTMACKGSVVTLSLSGAQTYSMGSAAITNPFSFTPASQSILSFAGADQHGCSSTAVYTQLVSDCISIREHTFKSHVEVYPNPSNGMITVSSQGPGRAEIINCIGQSVFSTICRHHEEQLDLGHLPDGVYFLQYEGAEKVVRKFIIKR